MTVIDVIQRGTDFLAKKQVESPRLQVELLLAHVLKLPRMQLYLNFDRVLEELQVTTVRGLVTRRGQREPLQQIMGTAPFCGLELRVNRNVLVPRPETELLAECACGFLGRFAPESVNVLDFGTGSGCLAIAIASRIPAARVWAVDLSPEALAVARDNAIEQKVAVEFLDGDGFSVVPAAARFHLIVSNPPYIPTAEIDALEPEVKDFEPRLALDGGADGLAVCRKLAVWARDCLRPEGRLMMEFGDGQGPAIESLLTGHKWVVEAVAEDYSRRQRFVVAAPGPG